MITNLHNNIANSNTDFDLNIDDLSDFMDSTERNDATEQPTLVTNDRIKDKAIYLTSGYLSVTFNVFFSIVVFVVTVRIRKFAIAGFFSGFLLFQRVPTF